MAEPTTQPLPQEPPRQDFVYRPLSGVAVASVVVGGLFALVILVCAVAAVWRGEPFLLPLWLLLLPAAGVGLAVLGRWHILRSEDTRAGMGLTQWGLGLSLVFGLGYATFYFVTYLAVAQQSNAFLLDKGPDSGYLARLQAGDINGAFLLTLPLQHRRGAQPNNPEAMEQQFDLGGNDREPRGLLTQFHADPLVRRLAAAGDKATIEPLAVRNWTYENQGYKVERFYRISTDEGSFEVLLTTQSVNSPEGEGRKWYLVWSPRQGISQLQLTDEGRKLKALREESARFANEWFVKLFTSQSKAAFLDTLPLKQRAQLRRPGAWDAPTSEQLKAFMAAGGVFHTDALRTIDPRNRRPVLDALAKFVVQPIQGQKPIEVRPEEALLSAVTGTPPGPVSVTHQFEFALAISQTGQSRKHAVPFIVMAAITLEAPPTAEAAANDPQRWRVARVEFRRAVALNLGPPPGPGGPGGPR